MLIGPPTAGKSSVGALLAAELGVPFADTDALVAEAAGKPVGDIFVDDGELVFREFERGAVARGLDEVKAGGGVLALGSGAVLDPDVRRMLAGQVVVYLEAEFATVAKRTGMDRPRVVIPGNPRGRLRVHARGAAPGLRRAGVAHRAHRRHGPRGGGGRPGQAAARMSGETRIAVGGDQPYEVVVGTGVLSALPGLVGKRAETVAVIHDERLARAGRRRPAARSREAGYRVAVADVPSGRGGQGRRRARPALVLAGGVAR